MSIATPYTQRNPNLPWGYWLTEIDGLSVRERYRDEEGNLWSSVREYFWVVRLGMGRLIHVEVMHHALEFLLAYLVTVDRRSYLISAEWNRALHSRPQCSPHTLRYEMLRYGLNPRHRRQTHVIGVQERLLRGFAGDFEFSLASPGAAVRTEAAMASNRAQAIWLAWSFLCLSGDPEYDAIMAAFRAWRMMNGQHSASETGS
jgi:hypothetical protein